MRRISKEEILEISDSAGATTQLEQTKKVRPVLKKATNLAFHIHNDNFSYIEELYKAGVRPVLVDHSFFATRLFL